MINSTTENIYGKQRELWEQAQQLWEKNKGKKTNIWTCSVKICCYLNPLSPILGARMDSPGLTQQAAQHHTAIRSPPPRGRKEKLELVGKIETV